MHIIPTHMTIADYCDGLEGGSITVDRRYQRSNQVWPANAQSFLVETIISGFPLPKLSLYQKTDRVSRTTVRDIIDGQQRSEAIKRFYDGELRLSKTLDLEEARGCVYEDLSDDLQDAFLSYSLGIDLFVEATEEDVREVFRRINSYTVPLNPEEQRHAQYQGDFKWYIYHLAKALDRQFVAMGAFTTRQMVRMQDMKLLTEMTHALLYGIDTTSKAKLEALYSKLDDEFPESDGYGDQIRESVATLFALPDLHNGPLMRTHVLYSLLLGIIHAQHNVPKFDALVPGGRGLDDTIEMSARLSELAEVIESKAASRLLAPFLKASTDRTNVRDQREVRFQFLCEAVSLGGGFASLS